MEHNGGILLEGGSSMGILANSLQYQAWLPLEHSQTVFFSDNQRTQMWDIPATHIWLPEGNDDLMEIYWQCIY